MQQVQVGYQTFVHDGDSEFGAVRDVSPDGLVIYVENAGMFDVKWDASSIGTCARPSGMRTTRSSRGTSSPFGAPRRCAYGASLGLRYPHGKEIRQILRVGAGQAALRRECW